MNAQGLGRGKLVGREPFFHGWFIVGILFFISILDGGFSYIFAAFLKPLAQDFGWTRAETSGAFSLYLLAAGLVLPLWGWLADSRSVRLVFLLSALIDGIALLLLGFVHSLTAFYALYLFLGIGLGGIGPTTVGKIISQWFVAKRGRAMGIALVGAGAGGLLLVPLAGLLIAEFHWRTAYQALAVLALGGLLPLVWFFLTDTPQEKGLLPLGQESDTESATAAAGMLGQEVKDWTLKEALSTPTFWLLGVTFGLGITAATAINTHQVAFLQDAGLTLEAASTIAGVTLGLSMGGRLIVGWVSEHLRHLHYILSFCLVMQAAGVGLLLYLQSLGWWVLTLFVPLFGLGLGGLVVLWPLAVGQNFGLRSFGAIAGVLGTVALSLGGALGPVAAGAIYDSTGSYHWAFLLCSGLLLLGAGVAALAAEPHAARPVFTPGYTTAERPEDRPW
jgi:sugar phosphate permease